MGNYRDLRVWGLAQELARDLLGGTARLAPHHSELRDQLRRAAISIPANIAEGADRGGDREFVRFLRISLASSAECETLLLLAMDSGAINRESGEKLQQRLDLTRRMLRTLITRIEPPKNKPRRP